MIGIIIISIVALITITATAAVIYYNTNSADDTGDIGDDPNIIYNLALSRDNVTLYLNAHPGGCQSNRIGAPCMSATAETTGANILLLTQPDGVIVFISPKWYLSVISPTDPVRFIEDAGDASVHRWVISKTQQHIYTILQDGKRYYLYLDNNDQPAVTTDKSKSRVRVSKTIIQSGV